MSFGRTDMRPWTQRGNRSAAGFTLLELLVVIDEQLHPYYGLSWNNRAYHCPGYGGQITGFAGSLPHDPLGSYAFNADGVGSYDSLDALYMRGQVSFGLSSPRRHPLPVSQAQIVAPAEMWTSYGIMCWAIVSSSGHAPV